MGKCIIEKEGQGLLKIKKEKRHYVNNGGVIRIDPEALQILIDFADQSGVPIKQLASQFIRYASSYAVIEEE